MKQRPRASAAMAAAAAAEQSSEAMKAITEPMHRILMRYREDGEVTKAWEGVVGLLKQHPSLLWTSVAHPTNVGVHYDNRGTLGVVAFGAAQTYPALPLGGVGGRNRRKMNKDERNGRSRMARRKT